MVRHKKPLDLPGHYSKDEILEFSEIVDEYTDLRDDLQGLALHITRLEENCKARFPNNQNLRRLLERARERNLSYAYDLDRLLKAYKRAIADFEHLHGPVFYEPGKRVFSYTVGFAEIVNAEPERQKGKVVYDDEFGF